MPRKRFDHRVVRRLVGVVHEKFRRLVHRHPLRMHSDSDQVAARAHQRHLQLRQPVLRVAVMQALVEHHLLAVKRPSLDVGARAINQANDIRVVPVVEELHVMAGKTSCTEVSEMLGAE